MGLDDSINVLAPEEYPLNNNTPSDEPIADAGEWVLGDRGDSCTKTCRKNDTTCAVESMNAIDTEEEMLLVIASIGESCPGGVAAGRDGKADRPGLNTNNGACLYGMDGSSDCDVKHPNRQRLCCCGGRCISS